jgi:deoxyribodipyrimidine photolyase
MLQHAYGVRLGVDYPHPIVDHAAQRPKVMAMFAAARTDAAGESDGKNG